MEYSDGTVLKIYKHAGIKNASGSVEISEIPPDMTKDKLIMILENKKRYGGGKIAEIQYNKCNKTALVAFEDQRGKELHLLIVFKVRNSDHTCLCSHFFRVSTVIW